MNICLWEFDSNGTRVWQVHAGGQPLTKEFNKQSHAWDYIRTIARSNPEFTFSRWNDRTQAESNRVSILNAVKYQSGGA